VAGAVGVARLPQVSELVIGLTIVSASTSLPEAAASIIASLRGQRDIAVGNVVGNVVGSNLFNILAALGLSVSIAPGGLAVAPAALTFALPVMIAAATFCLPMFFTGGRIARWEGPMFLGYDLAYTLI
jgi:cation:H+ antiporter